MNEREKYLESIYGPCHTGEFETGTVVHFKDAITRVIHTAMIEWIASPISAGGRVPAYWNAPGIDTGPAHYNPNIGDDHESIETHLQELNEQEHRQAEGEY